MFYTFGYRISWTDFSIQSTGGIFVTTQPRSATVLIDQGDHTSSLFSGSLFVQNLKPGTHFIQISKDGFSTWSKNLPVVAHTVTEARAVLVPVKPAETVLGRGPFTDFMASPNARMFILRERTTKDTFLLTFFSREQQGFLSYADATTREIAKANQNLPTTINWSGDEQSAIAELGNDWVQLSVQDGNVIQLASLYQKTDLVKKLPKKPRLILPHPSAQDQLYILEAENLYLWNTSSRVLRPLLDTVAGVTVQSGRLLILDSLSGFLYETGLDAQSPRQLTLAGIPGLKRAEIEQSGDKYFIESNKGYWLFDSEEQNLQVLSTASSTQFYIARNNTLWWNEHEIWIRWTVPEKELPYFQTAPQEKVFETKQTIQAVFYYPRQDYLIIQLDKTIYVIELDGRGDSRNIIKFYEGENPVILVPPLDRAVYIIDRSTLFELALER